MSLDRTLKTHGGMLRTRSVLTRAERIERLADEGKFDPESDSPLGLPKVRVRTSKAGTKTKKAEEPKPEAAEGAPAEAGAKQEQAKGTTAGRTDRSSGGSAAGTAAPKQDRTRRPSSG